MAGVITPGVRISGPTKVGSYVSGGTSSYGQNVSAEPLVAYRKSQKAGYKGTYQQFLKGGTVQASPGVGDVSKAPVSPQVQTPANIQTTRKVQTPTPSPAESRPRTKVSLPGRRSYAQAGGGIYRTVTPRPRGSPEGRKQASKVAALGYEYSFGKRGKQYVGVSLLRPGILDPRAEIPVSKVPFVREVLPTTPGGVLLTGAGVKGFTYLPQIAQSGLKGVFAYSGTRQAVDPSLSLEKRIGGGIIGGASALGLISDVRPFAAGALARLSPKYKSVVPQKVGSTTMERQLFGQTAKTIKNIEPDFDIRIIEPGKGFKFSTKAQEKFVGKRVDLVSAQRGFIEKSGRAKEIGDPEGSGLGLFYTPSAKGQPGAVRESRLGLVDTRLKKLFSLQDSNVGIEFKRTKPQILLERDILVTKTGMEPGTVRGIGYPSSELEVTRRPTALTGKSIVGSKIGVTSIRGQKVDIFKVTTDVVPDITKISGKQIPGTRIKIKGGIDPNIYSQQTKRYISPSGLLGYSSGVAKTSKLIPSSPPRIPARLKITPPRAPMIAPPRAPVRAPPRVPKIPRIAPPRAPPRAPRIAPPRAPMRAPPRAPRIAPPRAPPATPGIPRPKFQSLPRQKISKYLQPSFTPIYVPSLTAGLFKIKGPKGPRSPATRGLGIRPL